MKQREQRVQRRTESTEDILFSLSSLSSLSSLLHDSELDEIVGATIPETERQRNRCIFELCRSLKAVPRFSDADPKGLRPIVVAWHKRALPNIRTKDFSETWIDFLQAWPKVKYPKGTGPMDTIFQRAKSSLPAEAAQLDQSGQRLLLSLCRELQRESGADPFYISCRTAGRLLGVTHVTTWRWLFLLVAEGLLEVAEPGHAGGNRATRYLYRGSMAQ